MCDTKYFPIYLFFFLSFFWASFSWISFGCFMLDVDTLCFDQLLDKSSIQDYLQFVPTSKNFSPFHITLLTHIYLQRFAAVIMRIREPKTTALIFASGKMVSFKSGSEWSLVDICVQCQVILTAFNLSFKFVVSEVCWCIIMRTFWLFFFFSLPWAFGLWPFMGWVSCCDSLRKNLLIRIWSSFLCVVMLSRFVLGLRVNNSRNLQQER